MNKTSRLKTLQRIFRFFYNMEDMLVGMKASISNIERTQAIFAKQYLSKREAAIYLDKTINYIDNLIRSREVPYYQPNGYGIYIARADLDRYMTKTRFKSEEELKREAVIPHSKK